MLTFECSAQNRKELVTSLKELTGLNSRYAGAPSFAYVVGPYTVARDGTLSIEETEADRAVLSSLLDAGMISGEFPAMGQATADETAPAIEKHLEGEISFPIDGHTGASLRNLVNMIYTRAPLLSKATDGFFEVEKRLIDILEAEGTPESVEGFRALLASYGRHGGLYGFKIAEDRIIFTGFGDAEDSIRTKGYMELAARMNQMALTQKHIQAKEISVENEKYSFRVWLVRLGVNGPEFRELRHNLMERLSGHTAWLTAEQVERAKVKNAQKRAGAALNTQAI